MDGNEKLSRLVNYALRRRKELEQLLSLHTRIQIRLGRFRLRDGSRLP